LAENAPDQGAAMQQPAGVKFRSERHERRLGNDGFIEIKEGGSHVSMLGPFIRAKSAVKSIKQ
jgi:predicted RNA binding protein YcfA (HicA-like mRNA interferase family)